MKKLCLHIGIEKTGTSALQRCLAKSEKFLAEKDFYYPHTGRWHDHSHHRLAFSLLQTNRWDPNIQDARVVLKATLDEFVSSGFNNLIISSEILRKFCKHENFNLFDDLFLSFFDQIDLIVFVRSQLDWLMSLYCQNVKDFNVKYSKSPQDFVSEFKEDACFDRLVGAWFTALPFEKSKIHVLKYEKRGDDFLLNQFARACGFEFFGQVDGLANVNPSVQRPALDLIRYFNREKIDAAHRKSLNNLIMMLFKDSSVDPLRGDFRLLSSDEEVMLRDFFADSNKNLFERWGVLNEVVVGSVDRKDYKGLTIKNLSLIVQALVSRGS